VRRLCHNTQHRQQLRSQHSSFRLVGSEQMKLRGRAAGMRRVVGPRLHRGHSSLSNVYVIFPLAESAHEQLRRPKQRLFSTSTVMTRTPCPRPGAHPRERRDAQPRPRLPRVRRVRPLHGRPLLRPVPLLPLPTGLAAMLGAVTERLRWKNGPGCSSNFELRCSCSRSRIAITRGDRALTLQMTPVYQS